MQLTSFITLAIAGLAVASPVANSGRSANLEKRGVLIEVCMAGCAAACAVSPPVCASCLVGCLGTADDGGEVDLDEVNARVEKFNSEHGFENGNSDGNGNGN